jgi:hypothetical protein
VLDIQGGAINSELLFAGQLPLPLGGCKGQISKKPMGGGVSDDINGGLVVDTPSVALDIACRQRISLSSVWASNI